jgi:hypothetical protein
MDTIIIAQILGIFFVVTGLAMLANSKGVGHAIEASAQDRGTLFVWGILALLIGAIVVVLNNMWTSGLPLLVTILGWLAIVKGVFILILPNAAASLYRKFNKSGILVFCGLVVFVLGLILLYW